MLYNNEIGEYFIRCHKINPKDLKMTIKMPEF